MYLLFHLSFTHCLNRNWTMETTGRVVTVNMAIANLTATEAGLYQPRVHLMTSTGTDGYVALRPLLDLKAVKCKFGTNYLWADTHFTMVFSRLKQSGLFWSIIIRSTSNIYFVWTIIHYINFLPNFNSLGNVADYIS